MAFHMLPKPTCALSQPRSLHHASKTWTSLHFNAQLGFSARDGRLSLASHVSMVAAEDDIKVSFRVLVRLLVVKWLYLLYILNALSETEYPCPIDTHFHSLKGQFIQTTKPLLSSFANSFGFMHAGCEISAFETFEAFATTRIQWSWMEFQLCCSKRWKMTFEKLGSNVSWPKTVFIGTIFSVESSSSKICW